MTIKERKFRPPIVTKHPFTHSFIHSFLHFFLLSAIMDHGDTFHCPLHHPPQKEHHPGVQSRDQSIITLQVTRMSLYCMVGAVTQVRGDSHGVWGRGGEPLGNGFQVRSHTSSSSSVTMPLASGQDANKGTSCGARNSPNRAGRGTHS